MRGKIATTALATAMITSLVAASPALASPSATSAATTAPLGAAATYTGHGHGSGWNHDSERAGATYAEDLVSAWGAGDTAEVNAMATADVAQTLLTYANPGGAGWVHTSSRAISGITFSSFVDRFAAKALVVGVLDSAVDGDHAAVIARFVDYPEAKMTPKLYAIDLVAAWGSGDDTRVDAMATDDVAATLRDFADPGGDEWKNTSSRTISGITFSSFVNRDAGMALVLGVQDSEIDGEDAAVIARFVDYPTPESARKHHDRSNGWHGWDNGWRHGH